MIEANTDSPICDECKKYGLDHSTISADFNYVLYQTSREKQYPIGVRDKDRGGKSIDDFWKMSQSKKTNMKKSEAVSLRLQGCHTGTTRVAHVRREVNSPHYRTCGDFEFFFEKKFVSLPLSALHRDFLPSPKSTRFFFLQKIQGKGQRIRRDEDINATFTCFH